MGAGLDGGDDAVRLAQTVVVEKQMALRLKGGLELLQDLPDEAGVTVVGLDVVPRPVAQAVTGKRLASGVLLGARVSRGKVSTGFSGFAPWE